MLDDFVVYPENLKTFRIFYDAGLKELLKYYGRKV